MSLHCTKLALACCLIAKASDKAAEDCAKQDMRLLQMPFYGVVDSVAAQRNAQTLPIFIEAAECVALERKTIGRASVSEETAQSLKRELDCWRELAAQAADFTSKSSVMAQDGSRVKLEAFWQAKRLEILRDHTALSSIGAVWHRSWRLGVLTSKNIDKHVKLLREGLQDPAFRCQSRWWHAFDSRHELLSNSVWKRYAELLVAMRSFGAKEVAETFQVATSLLDNRQQWQSVHAVHAQLPGLRASPVWDKGAFPWLLRLEERFPEVQRELLAAIKTTGLLPNPDDFLHDKPNDWQQLALLLNGQWNKAVCQHLTPVTCSLLEDRPEFDADRIELPEVVSKAVTEEGFKLKKPVPMVKVYNLQAGAWLRPHFGSHGRLAAHLGLAVPEGCCSLTVGGEQLSWEEGKVMVFDDAFVHEASNAGSQPRFVLGIFFVHPDFQAPTSTRAEL